MRKELPMLKSWIAESPKTSLFWIALLRIMLGLLFLTQWYDNLVNGLYTEDGLNGLFSHFFSTSEMPLEWYMDFIDRLVMPITPVFAVFQLVAELLIGLAFLFGFLTPLVSLAAGFFILNTFLLSWGADWPWSYLTILSILGVLFFTKAGRAIGIDGWLYKRAGNRFPLW
jgi:NADH dehydrogenase